MNKNPDSTNAKEKSSEGKVELSRQNFDLPKLEPQSEADRKDQLAQIEKRVASDPAIIAENDAQAHGLGADFSADYFPAQVALVRLQDERGRYADYLQEMMSVKKAYDASKDKNASFDSEKYNEIMVEIKDKVEEIDKKIARYKDTVAEFEENFRQAELREAIQLPPMETSDEREARWDAVEQEVIAQPDLIQEVDARGQELGYDYVHEYLPGQIRLAQLDSDKQYLSDYLRQVMDKKKVFEASKDKKVKFDTKKYDQLISQIKTELVKNAEERSVQEARVQKFEEEYEKKNLRFLQEIPPLETDDDEDARHERAERGVKNELSVISDLVDKLGVDRKEFDDKYAPARLYLATTESDINYMLAYKKKLEARAQALRDSGLDDPEIDFIEKFEAELNKALAERTKEVKELREAIKRYEDELEKEAYRQETGMPATTNREALFEAGKDLAAIMAGAAAIGSVAAIAAGMTVAQGGYEVAKTGAKAAASVPKKAAKGVGAVAGGATSTGLIGTGVIAGAVVELFNTIREVFTGKKPDQK